MWDSSSNLEIWVQAGWAADAVRGKDRRKQSSCLPSLVNMGSRWDLVDGASGFVNDYHHLEGTVCPMRVEGTLSVTPCP